MSGQLWKAVFSSSEQRPGKSAKRVQLLPPNHTLPCLRSKVRGELDRLIALEIKEQKLLKYVCLLDVAENMSGVS